jgi:pimeloyl-ACP methyl ester carboxylesterase
MGADERMYPGPWHSLPDTEFLRWPAYAGEESIDAVVWRMVAEHNITPGSVVIGSSLGGMVACEIANRMTLSGFFLLGSACDPSEVNRILAALHPLANMVPFRQLQSLLGKLPQAYGDLFMDADPEFVRSMCHAIFKWNGLQRGVQRPIRLHGLHDLVIPCPAQVDLKLDGGHLISLTHAPECVAYIRKRLDLEPVS